jgi:apolipoprotein N-acyltransferase
MAFRPLQRLAVFLRETKGWRRAPIAFGAGALSALAFAPFGIFPLLLAGYAVLALLTEAAKRRKNPVRDAFVSGWWFGFGQFLIGLHWIGYAFMVDPSAHAWQLPFVAILFPGGLALITAASTAAAARLRYRGTAQVFGFTVCIAVGEWLRGHILTGFPWNIAAYGWGASPAVMQSAALFGAYGLTLLTILFGASLAEPVRARPRWKLPAVVTGLFIAFFIGGTVRLAAVHPDDVEGVRLRIVQPVIPQSEKYRPPFVERNWRRLTGLSEQTSSKKPTIVIWPEAAPPFLLAYSYKARDWVVKINAQETLLMTGAIRYERDAEGEPRYYNSFYILGRGEALGVYDKAHLVPFGEYLPFEKTLGRLGLNKLTGIEGSFGSGSGPRSFAVPGAPAVGPLICYEILFPGEVVGAERPGWFVNVTDDSWFGPWAGPAQHLLVAQMRAIEEGLPVARAANTGISAIIDPLGRITAYLGLNKAGFLDGGLPSPIAETPYSRLRIAWFWLLIVMISMLAWLFPARK